jgi:hypothetical protein
MDNNIELTDMRNISKINTETDNILESDINTRMSPINSLVTSVEENKEIIQLRETDIKAEKSKEYRLSLKWYLVYLLYGFFGGIFINIITCAKMVNFDMAFNILLSPIIYYNSPRKILTRISKNEFIYYYTLPFIVGLFFRFLDYMPVLNQLTLNPDNINTGIKIGMVSIVIIMIIVLLSYYIYISSEPLINSLLFLVFTLTSTLTGYYYYNNNGNIHIHHYFLGLIIMLLSKNYNYKLVIIAHAVAYAIYIEGISMWGFGPIFWQNN